MDRASYGARLMDERSGRLKTKDLAGVSGGGFNVTVSSICLFADCGGSDSTIYSRFRATDHRAGFTGCIIGSGY